MTGASRKNHMTAILHPLRQSRTHHKPRKRTSRVMQNNTVQSSTESKENINNTSLDNSEKSDKIKEVGIDNVTGENATIDERKFTEYALNPEKAT